MFILILLLTISFNLYSFNYKNYTDTDLDEIVEILKEAIKHPQNFKGYTIWRKGITLKYSLKEYPKKITKDNIPKLFYYQKIYGLGSQMIRMYKHQLEFNYNGQEIILIFQSVLIPYLKKEIRLNEEFYLYAMLGLYSDFDKKLIIFVNEFDKRKLS